MGFDLALVKVQILEVFESDQMNQLRSWELILSKLQIDQVETVGEILKGNQVAIVEGK
jgi:hypothetical protein